MRKAAIAAFLCGVLAGLPIVAQANTVGITANVVDTEVVLQVTPASIDFGDVTKGGATSSQQITIKNQSSSTSINLNVGLVDYPSSYGDVSSDPGVVGLYWHTGGPSAYFFQPDSFSDGPNLYLAAGGGSSLYVFMKAGANAPSGPVSFTLEFRPQIK